VFLYLKRPEAFIMPTPAKTQFDFGPGLAKPGYEAYSNWTATGEMLISLVIDGKENLFEMTDFKVIYHNKQPYFFLEASTHIGGDLRFQLHGGSRQKLESGKRYILTPNHKDDGAEALFQSSTIGATNGHTDMLGVLEVHNFLETDNEVNITGNFYLKFEIFRFDMTKSSIFVEAHHFDVRAVRKSPTE
jgi:hypothetical protein